MRKVVYFSIVRLQRLNHPHPLIGLINMVELCSHLIKLFKMFIRTQDLHRTFTMNLDQDFHKFNCLKVVNVIGRQILTSTLAWNCLKPILNSFAAAVPFCGTDHVSGRGGLLSNESSGPQRSSSFSHHWAFGAGCSRGLSFLGESAPTTIASTPTIFNDATGSGGGGCDLRQSHISLPPHAVQALCSGWWGVWRRSARVQSYGTKGHPTGNCPCPFPSSAGEKRTSFWSRD